MPTVKMLPPFTVGSPPIAWLTYEGEQWAGGSGGVVYWDGSEWQWRIKGLTLSTVLALAHTGEWLIAGGIPGIARSKDGGQSWEMASLPSPTMINALLVVRETGSDPIILAASMESGILRSDDGGMTWTDANFGLADLGVTSLAAFKGAVYAGSRDGIYRSPNQGRAWKLVKELWDVAELQVIDDQLVAAYEDNGCEAVSTEDGSRWVDRTDLPNWTEWNVPETVSTPRLHDLRRIIVSGDYVFLGGGKAGLYRLNHDAENTQAWVRCADPFITFVGRFRDAIYTSGMDGACRSDDMGETWIKLRDGNPLSHLSFMPNGIGYGCTTDGSTLVRTPDGGITWQETPSPFGVLPVAALQATPSIIFAAVFDPRRQVISLWRSSDGGQRWFPGAEMPSLYPIAASWGDPAMIALPGVVLVSGADPTGAWRRAEFDTPDVTIRTFAGDASRLYALSLISGVFVSEDRGAHWRHLPLDLPQDELMDICVEAGRLYVLMVGGRAATALIYSTCSTSMSRLRG